MTTQPYWITNNLAIVARPRGGDWLDDEMAALRSAGIDVVVSMLESAEIAELGLSQEGASAERAGLIFKNFPIQDRGVPANHSAFENFLVELEQRQSQGNRVGIHCRACIGRAAVTAASLLVRSGVTPKDAWKQISVARGCDVPDTVEQREWVNRSMVPRT